MGIIAEHLQAWLVEATREERPVMEKWDKVLDIIQSDFREGRITVDYSWKTVVFIPKGNRNFRGIGLVEVILKAVSGVANFLIGAAVDFHNTLHRFRSGRPCRGPPPSYP